MMNLSEKLSLGAGSKENALAAARKAAMEPKKDAMIKFIDPAEARERLRIVADDSGSMSGEVQNVKDGIVELLRNSTPNQTAVAVHLLCKADSDNPMSKLESDLPKLGGLVQSTKFGMGGTPLFRRMKETLEATPFCTRLVVFTDGSPTDSILEWKPYQPDEQFALAFPHEPDAIAIVNIAKSKEVPIDTIFFGSEEYNTDAVKLLKYLASETGGYFMVFDPQKVSFKKAFKYLSAGNRLMLASESVRKEIESGKRS